MRADRCRRRPAMLDGDTTRERLLAAAGPIFAERGFEAASIRDIAREAGANLGAVNYHFRSKEQLYLETVKCAYESVARAVPLPQWPAGTPAEQKLREFVRVFLRRVFSQPATGWCGPLILREVAQPTEAC